MRARWVVVLALVGATMGAVPAYANVGADCGGWKVSSDGAHQNACYIRDADWHIAAKGRAYYDGSAPLDQLNISVTLQRSTDNTTWTSVVSKTCGFVDGDIPNDIPGSSCFTSARYVDAGVLYRTRTFLVLFFRSGAVKVTTPSYSGITS